MDFESLYRTAHDKFFAENPRALVEIESVSRSLIEAVGITVEEYRKQKRREIFADAAKRSGLDIDEFVIRLVAESPEQAQAWRLERQSEIADILGIEWSEYKIMNNIFD
ncbi:MULTISPECIES: DUF6388 family protein [Pseudomonas aeruginosa group]|uniref:DUF6388 family protein n=1 Tax=Pseudomonas aeruginosa group TaxID=136841 RepID=UPI001A2A13D6|nr:MULTISPECIES: DUF6388 family protein [Pseudomonas aeruginosa group]MBG6886107.1 hypothetical protein [Pseudomonas aeruginosa]MCY0315472.1 DUF6388 family protein [Pseudomonas aeruginosa]MCY0517507.1 DUF6388 family protein [Pseudomonas aeruginosa]MDI3610648.1 DUF6388 family protein [Pseudomonas aeruginosa]MDI3677569.1 DUF6388 family protein [Pseudomonas aeruginosa]